LSNSGAMANRRVCYERRDFGENSSGQSRHSGRDRWHPRRDIYRNRGGGHAHRDRRYDTWPENGFDIYLNNLVNKEVIVERSDFHFTIEQGILVKRNYDQERNISYIVLETPRDDSLRIDMWDVSMIRPVAKLKYNPVYQKESDAFRAPIPTLGATTSNAVQNNKFRETNMQTEISKAPAIAQNRAIRPLRPYNRSDSTQSLPYDRKARPKKGKIQSANLADLVRIHSGPRDENSKTPPLSTTPPH